MGKIFNVTGDCKPEIHYMVNLTERLETIKRMIDAGQYFSINRARQYGKTTTLGALERFLSDKYYVVSLDFQMLGYASFETEQMFVSAFSNELLVCTHQLSDEIRVQLVDFAAGDSKKCTLQNLFRTLSRWCGVSQKPVVLMIDEVDSAANNQVFLDFLSQLRGYYMKRTKVPAFQSVILAGVYDVKNIRRKLRPEDEHKMNSPWNIAADFDVVMSFSKKEIAEMLLDYEEDHHTGMDIEKMSGLLSDYTSGYPFLVSRLCKLIDEKVGGNGENQDKSAARTHPGFLEAVRILLTERNALFDSLIGKLQDFPDLKIKIYELLFGGKKIIYNPDDAVTGMAEMFGFVKNDKGTLTLSNRIFEMRLYNYFLTTNEAQNNRIFEAASEYKSQFIREGHLDMDMVMEKYVEHFDSIYGDHYQEFDEEEGRRRFLLYIRPIINGIGNYYIEPETRNARRMDVVVDYPGERFVIELKIWRGTSYNERGEKQLSDYLDYFGLKRGYMLSYNFNQKKVTGVREIHLGDRVLVEATV